MPRDMDNKRLLDRNRYHRLKQDPIWREKERKRCREHNNRIYNEDPIKNGFPDTLRTLCYNCNCGRRVVKDRICPHIQNPINNDWEWEL
jgi:hypothetical protein